MVLTLLKIALFAFGWLMGRAALRAGARAGAFEGGHARLALRAAIACVVVLFWHEEIRWAATHPSAVARGVAVLALTAVPVGAFVLFLRWAHRRAGAQRSERD